MSIKGQLAALTTLRAAALAVACLPQEIPICISDAALKRGFLRLPFLSFDILRHGRCFAGLQNSAGERLKIQHRAFRLLRVLILSVLRSSFRHGVIRCNGAIFYGIFDSGDRTAIRTYWRLKIVT